MKGSFGAEFQIILIGGMLLSFNAGHLNGVTILQDHPTTTTHMTGNATYLGISIALLNYRKMFFYTSLIFSYILGSFISGLMIPYQSFSISFGYGKVFILVSILLSISALIDIYHTSDYIFYDLLVACASGLQNGMVSRYSGNILRIGHVTGVCTDIGVNVGRYLMGTKDNLWRIQILLALLFTFFFGGCLAQLLHHQLGKYQLLLSAGISFSIGFGYILYLRLSSFQLTFFESIFGFTIQEMNPRESIETNFIISRESILQRRSMQLSTIEVEAAYDEDYELTDEEAKQLHCQTNGELLEEQQLNNDEEKVVVDDSSVRNTLHLNEPARSLRRPILPVIPSLAPAPPSTLHPLQKRNKIEFSLIVVGAMLFSLNAGIINSISANASRGYLVSHVTGSTTNAALELSSKRFGEMSIHLALIFSFTFGSFLVGLMVPSSVFRFGISYTRVFLLEGLFLFIAALSNLRVVTNHEDQDQYSLFFYYICSLSCGLQNAIVTKYSGGVIRTTHPTGGFCDIGSIFGRMVTGNTTDLWQLQILIPLVLCFILGGVVGTGLHVWIGRDALLVNVGFIFVVSGWYLFYLKTISRTELTYLQLLFGKYTYPFVNRIRQTITHLRARNTANSSHSNR